MKQLARKQTGFTIVELLIVIVVIAILAAITIVAYNGIQNQSKASSLKSELSQVTKALETKKIVNGVYPSSLADVNVTSSKLTYHYNQRANTYCIDGKEGAFEFSVRGSTMQVVEEACILQGMALWLPLNGTLSDASGNENVVTASTTLSVTTGAGGRSNGAYSFNGNNQYLTVQNADSIPSQTERFTASVWAYGTGVNGTDYGYMVHKGAANSIGESVFFLGTNSGAAQSLIAAANGQYGKGTTSVGSNSSTWRHLVLVYAGGYASSFVDGVRLRDENVGAMVKPTTGTTLTIGGGTSGYRDLTGAVDDVRVYNRALTDAEVMNLFNAGAQ